jgi:hypothetical protein
MEYIYIRIEKHSVYTVKTIFEQISWGSAIILSVSLHPELDWFVWQFSTGHHVMWEECSLPILSDLLYILDVNVASMRNSLYHQHISGWYLILHGLWCILKVNSFVSILGQKDAKMKYIYGKAQCLCCKDKLWMNFMRICHYYFICVTTPWLIFDLKMALRK